ncbi:MAG: hypothetical protein MJY87_01895 [Fibrobacter sp.]|nr:hypothetical protein [Fibrobacter sp.]
MSHKNLVGCIPVLFILMIVALYLMPRSEKVNEDTSENLTPEEIHRVEVPFEGRVVLPEASDFEVVDNSANRDLDQVALFMKGRAAGLHWLANEHFKKASRKNPLPDVRMELNISIDSMGVFFVSLKSSNSKDKSMDEDLLDHIKKYWRYRRSTSGKTELIVPFTWTSRY